MIAIENGIGKGSMRTIPEFPLLGVLKENADLLLNFGGHDYAAGLHNRPNHAAASIGSRGHVRTRVEGPDRYACETMAP